MAKTANPWGLAKADMNLIEDLAMDLEPMAEAYGLSDSPVTTGRNIPSKVDPGIYQKAFYESAEELPFIQQQKQDIDQAEQLLSMQAQAPQDFYSGPIAALLQSEFGKSADPFLAGQGVTPEERRAQLLKQIQGIQEQRKDLGQQIIQAGFLGKMKQGGAKSGLSPNAALADQRTKERYMLDTINKTMTPMEEGYNKLQQAKESLDQNDWLGTVSVLSVLAKNVGQDAGALSNQDLTRYLPKTFQGDLAKVESYLKSSTDVPIDPELASGLKRLVDRASRKIVERYSKSLERQVEQFKKTKSYQGIPVDDIATPARDTLERIKEFQDKDVEKEDPLVQVTRPDGEFRKIPQSKLDAALKAGWKKR